MPDTFNQVPIPIELRPSIRNTCEFFDESSINFTLNGEEISLTLFFEDNVDRLSANDFYNIFALERRKSIIFGGGASATSILRRIN